MEQNRHPGALSDITVEIPNGASGTRIAAFTIHLLDTKGRYGLFSSCCGGGLGVSTLIERV